MQDVEADVALLDSLEPLVHVLLPNLEPVKHGPVLVLENNRQKKTNELGHRGL